MRTLSATQGSRIPLILHTENSAGQPISYRGDETIETTVALIGGTTTFNPPSTFLSAADGTVSIDIPTTQTGIPGTYALVTRINGVDAGKALIIIESFPSIGTTTTTTAAPYFSPVLVSRYGIIPNDLKIHAMVLEMSEGIARRMSTADAMRFIIDAERQVEEQVSDFVAVPLKPVAPRPGLTPPLTPNQPSPAVPPPFPPSSTTGTVYSAEVAITTQGSKWHFPVEFIQAIIYRSIALMLRSEYFEVEPNTSQISVEADSRADSYIFLFRSRVTVLVGAGRRRNPNPHMPVNIAPRGNTNIPTPGSNR